MPKVSVYLPDELYRAAQAQGLPVSALAQEAIARELRARSTDRWVAAVRERSPRVGREVNTSELLAQVRDGFGA